LPNFFKTVKLSDADWMVYENKNLRENYGFNMIRVDLERKLDAWEMPIKPLRGVAWYNPLANPTYSRLFNYIECNLPIPRSDLIQDGDDIEGNDCEQSDIVSLALNMAFAPRKIMKSMIFGPGVSE
jgi:hypothetical protein